MRVSKMAKVISLITIFTFLLQFVFNMVPFVLTTDIEHYHSYQLITHLLLHKDLSHIVGNLLLFIVAAREVEKYYNDSFKFLTLYLASGIIGALFQMIAYAGVNVALVGASGAIYGILGATLLINPYQEISIFKFKIPFIIIALLMIIPEIISCINYTQDGIGHFCHIGGLLTGMVFYFFNKK